jgi:hypothetical protein
MRRVLEFAFVLAVLAGIIGTATIDFASAQEKKEKTKAGDAKPVTIIEVYKDSAGEFRFRIKHDDAVLAMASKGYKTKADCEKVIDILKRDVGKAKVEDESK